MAGDSVIGNKIRILREQQGLSSDELGERCGCEPDLIRQLESGELLPSLAPLIKITRSLGVRLGTLLDDDEHIGPVITRAGEASTVTRFKSSGSSGEGGSLDFAALAPDKAARHMEPFLIDVHPGTVDVALSSHEGEEFIYVLEGLLEIEYGKDVFALSPGDSIYYDSIVPHEVRAKGPSLAKIVAVVYAPS
ncbi:MAG: XRE family transcriptional regulator [Coriobacteriia bacterium]|nr:XRE family transcriptional regulator [Coriobacteriia bacterium]